MSIHSKLSRRTMLEQSCAGLVIGMSSLSLLPSSAKAQKARAMPTPSFKLLERNEGISGPYGVVRMRKSDKQALPEFVQTVDDLGLVDLREGKVMLRLGTGAEAIAITSAGVRFGRAREVTHWGKDTAQLLLRALHGNTGAARGALLLRSALATGVPVYARLTKTEAAPALSRAVLKSVAPGEDVQQRNKVGLQCEKVIENEFVDAVTEAVNQIKTAEQQFAECVAQTVRKDPCKMSPIKEAVTPCAMAICTASGFLDMVVGVITIVVEAAKTISREVTRCSIEKLPELIKVFDVTDFRGPLADLLGVPAIKPPTFSTTTIKEGLAKLKSLSAQFGPFAECFLSGTWSIAAAETPLSLGNHKVSIPYGVRVCLPAACARKLRLSKTVSITAANWSATVAALAAISPEFLPVAATLGIQPLTAVAAAFAAAPPAVVAVAAIILALVVLAMIYGTALAGQLDLLQLFNPRAFDDGEVCIEHPTFAIALTSMASAGTFGAAQLIPPIVMG